MKFFIHILINDTLRSPQIWIWKDKSKREIYFDSIIFSENYIKINPGI